MMRKWLAGVALGLVLFALPAQAAEIITYQKLKNITRQDDPAGGSMTVGFPGDTLRFLVFVKNDGAEAQEVFVTDLLPEQLIYAPASTFYYLPGTGLGWKVIADADGTFPLQGHRVELAPNQGMYFKFEGEIMELPDINLTLANLAQIKSAAGENLGQSITKILIPSYTQASPQQDREQLVAQVIAAEEGSPEAPENVTEIYFNVNTVIAVCAALLLVMGVYMWYRHHSVSKIKS